MIIIPIHVPKMVILDSSRIELSEGENNGYMQATRILNLPVRSTFKHTLSKRLHTFEAS